MKRLIAIFLIVYTNAYGAAVTFEVATPNTTSTQPFVSGSFTPAAGDLLVVFVYCSGTTEPGNMTDSQTLGMTKVTSGLFGTSANTIYCFVSNALAAASAMTVSFDALPDTVTGADIHVYAVAGMTKTGLTAIRQSAKQENITAGTTPAPVFSAAALTGNVVMGAVALGANPAGMTPPSTWSEGADDGYANPTSGMESVFLNSGFTGTTVTWGSTVGGAISAGALIVELDTTGSTETGNFFQLL